VTNRWVRLPIIIQGAIAFNSRRSPNAFPYSVPQILVTLYLCISGSIPLSSIAATQSRIDIPFQLGKIMGTMSSFVANDVDAALRNLQLKIHDTKTVINQMWLLERCVLA